jgi:hypothetical protein
MDSDVIAALRAFGRRTEDGAASAIAEGGFVVAGDASSDLVTLAETEPNEQHGAGSQGRRQVGQGEGQGAQTEASSPDQTAHAFGQLSIESVPRWELEGLRDYYPDVEVVGSHSRFALLSTTVGLLQTNHISARLYLELPMWPWERATRVDSEFGKSQAIIERRERAFVPMPPPVRAWAFWQGGVVHGLPVRSHHENPDGSICACMAHEWIRGVHRVLDYAAFCTSWIAKVLYEREFNRYPGTQHLPPWIRLERLRLDEKCGCGKTAVYRSCCWNQDRRLTKQLLARVRAENAETYFRHLKAQGRPFWPLGESFRRF